MRGVRATARAASCVSALVLLAACGHTTERERVDFERMRLQQKDVSYGGSSVFANTSSMQAPPFGTISRETSADTGVLGTGMRSGRQVADVPGPITPERLAVGQRKFTVYCAVCHGVAAFGGSRVAQNMGPPRPPSLRSAAVMARPAGYLFAIATHGIGRMPGYAPDLSAAERWDVVAYVRQLQHTPPATAAAIDDSLWGLAIARIDSAGITGRRP
jgi:mono/diheme cytochrome c family protein